jgi:hypothetical protein
MSDDPIRKFVESQKDMPAEFSKVVSDNFWKLIEMTDAKEWWKKENGSPEERIEKHLKRYRTDTLNRKMIFYEAKVPELLAVIDRQSSEIENRIEREGALLGTIRHLEGRLAVEVQDLRAQLAAAEEEKRKAFEVAYWIHVPADLTVEQVNERIDRGWEQYKRLATQSPEKSK